MHRLNAHLDALFPAPDDLSPWPLQEDAFPSIPGYEVEAILGRGGMGVVYKARHLRLNRTVAIKTLLGGGSAGPHERERFQREAEAVAALRHPNIVQLYDVGEEEGRPYFTMEFVDGGSLALKLAGSPQPARPSADLVSTLADAVHAAHRGGIVHRDLKPANVLLAADGTPKISDFGLARRLEGGAALTLSGVPVGTPSYMAPEQALGRAAAVGPATDVYALGAILYELLTGRPPFRAATAAETVQQVISQEPAPPSRLNAQVPRDLETICLKCLHKEPARRYSSAEELADDLRRFGEGRPIQARRVGWSERTWRWCRRNPTVAALTAASLVPIFMAVGGGLWLGRQSAERQGRAREAIEAVLAQVPGLRRQGRWPEAESILAQGRSRLVEAGSDDLRRQLAQAEKDLRLAAELERIRLTPSIEDNRFDYQGMAAAYAQAFAHAGLDVQGDIDTVSARIRSSDLRPQLVMALDHWVYVADGLGDTTSMTRLLGLARRPIRIRGGATAFARRHLAGQRGAATPGGRGAGRPGQKRTRERTADPAGGAAGEEAGAEGRAGRAAAAGGAGAAPGGLLAQLRAGRGAAGAEAGGGRGLLPGRPGDAADGGLGPHGNQRGTRCARARQTRRSSPAAGPSNSIRRTAGSTSTSASACMTGDGSPRR